MWPAPDPTRQALTHTADSNTPNKHKDMKTIKYLAIATLAFVAGACSTKTDQTTETQPDETTQVAETTATEAVITLGQGEAIDTESGKPVVIDFNATWCGPCRKFTPIFEEVAAKYADRVIFYSVDVDIHPDLAAQYEAKSIPQVTYIAADGKPTAQWA